MTEYRIKSTGELVNEKGLKQAFPETAICFTDLGSMADLVIATPIPVPTSELRVVLRDGVALDAQGNWAEAWKEMDRYTDIPGGFTQEEQETSYLTTLNQQKVDMKLEELAALRFEKETGGLLFGGTTIRTDRETQAVITGAYVKAKEDANRSVLFKGESGWVEIDSPTMIQLGTAIDAHVQACFRREGELAVLVNIDPETDITTGWPV
ncbi:MAG: hypothetical protein DRH26_04225 [Deltaproteobacteria bacterium]|nr:MAG: hypothetical protein DRH26_04225 [Deltaproteobacteria bacterium]